MKPRRVQLSRRKGWRMPENTAKVDRSTRWGNPYAGEGPTMDRAMLVRLYRDYMDRPEQLALRQAVRDHLRGKDLACWCPLDEPCHADVLLDIANEPDT